MLHKSLLLVLIVLLSACGPSAEEMARAQAQAQEEKSHKTVDVILNELPSPVVVISTSSTSSLNEFIGESISVKVRDGAGVITTLSDPSLTTVAKGDTLK